MSKSHGTRWLIAVAGLIALAAVSAPSWATESQALVIQEYTVNGPLLMVTVENTAAAPAQGTVQGTVVLMKGNTVTGQHTVTLDAGQTATVVLGFVEPIASTQEVSAQDESEPF